VSPAADSDQCSQFGEAAGAPVQKLSDQLLRTGSSAKTCFSYRKKLISAEGHTLF